MREIEERAEHVLAGVPEWIWDGESLPVPVEDIADTVFRLRVREVDDLSDAPGAPALEPGSSLSGLLLPAPRRDLGERREAREWPARRRFTIGHELGHWCMHRDRPHSHDLLPLRDGRSEGGAARSPAGREGGGRLRGGAPHARPLLREAYARDRDFGAPVRAVRVVGRRDGTATACRDLSAPAPPMGLARAHRGDSEGMPRPVILGIVGDSATGKTTISGALVDILGEEQVTHVATDDYHKYDREERKERDITPLHPECNYMDIIDQHCRCCARASRSSSRSTSTATAPSGRRCT